MDRQTDQQGKPINIFLQHFITDRQKGRAEDKPNASPPDHYVGSWGTVWRNSGLLNKHEAIK
jgi:hypothetical protein